MISDPLFYLAAIPAVMLLGLAKGGFAGIGMLAVPLMTLAVSPVQAASITLPVLIVQDVVSVWAFRRAWDRPSIAILLPSATLGIGIGYLLAARVSSAGVELALGLTAMLFALQRLWIERRPLAGAAHAAPAALAAPVKSSPAWLGMVCGVAAGFTSQLAHAGGPPFQIYMLSRRLRRDVFIGTSALFFAAVNWFKVPAYIALGQFTRENLATSGALLPLAVASTLAGAVLIRRLSGERFQTAMYIVLALVGAKLVWSGAAHLLA